MIQQLAQIRSLKAEHMIPTVVCFHFPAPKFGREKHSLDRWVASRAGNMALKPLVPVVPWRSRAKAPWLALRPPGGLEAHSRSRGNMGRGTLGGGAGEGKQRVVHFVSRNSLFRVVTSPKRLTQVGGGWRLSNKMVSRWLFLLAASAFFLLSSLVNLFGQASKGYEQKGPHMFRNGSHLHPLSPSPFGGMRSLGVAWEVAECKVDVLG